MSKCIYDKFSITLSDTNNRYYCDTLVSIDEYDHEIVFETIMPIDGINRGWVGDLFYHIGGFPMDDSNVKVTSVTCYKEVLLARVTISAAPASAVIWKYTFLKD